jgi:hypothetical protein
VCPEGFIEVVADVAEGRQMRWDCTTPLRRAATRGFARSDAATATSDTGK